MKKMFFNFIFALMLLGVLFGGFALADTEWFVNDGSETLPEFFDGVYAIGSSGTALLAGEEIYALTANGLRTLGAANSRGGGGLLYTDGEIAVDSDRVAVGLYYYYSKSRDTSLSTVTLENVSGNGFTFGFADPETGELLNAGSTSCGSVILCPRNGTGVSVYEPGVTTPIYTADVSGKSGYLIVRPVPEESEEDEEPILTVTRLRDREYYGEFGFPVLGNGKLTVVNILGIEEYVMGVCACEMTESWPLEALKAQAVAARTYVQKLISNSIYHYTCGFDVTADTYCQAYLGKTGVGERIREAAESTANQYLTYNGKLIDALYSAADGGATESNENVYGTGAYPYLVGVFDPFESAAAKINPYSTWSVTMTPAQLGSRLGIGPVETVDVTESDTGNVIKLDFVSTTGQKATVIRDSCRTVLGLKNIRYSVSRSEDGNFVFEGSGFGHNLGMSQWGAYAMAKYFEKDYQTILGFYYTKVGLSHGVLE